jgi:UDPglucose 6-dehydrogenase
MTSASSTVAIIGCGYLGAVFSAVLAEQGNQVIGLDVDQTRVSQLNAGVAPFFEPEFDQVLQNSLAAGKLTYTSNPADIAAAEIVFICVGTPQQSDTSGADLSQIWSAIDAISPHLAETAIVIGRSTVPVGTAAKIEERLKQKTNRDYHVSWNPEFLREGLAISDTRMPDRIVLGTESPDVEARLRKLYQPQLANEIPMLVMDVPTAELVKVAANAFLATKISFINAVSEIAEIAGADIVPLAQAIGLDARIGSKFLAAGVGFGGGCLPKDIRAFISSAQELGAAQSVKFLTEVDQINLRQRSRVVTLAQKAIGDLTGKKIVVLGAAFKPNSDDVRDSPALDVANLLHGLGAVVFVHDPKAIENAKAKFPKLNYQADLAAIFKDCDLVLHLTEWPIYRELDPVELRKIVTAPVLIDGRNILDFKKWRAAGWQVTGMGKKA